MKNYGVLDANVFLRAIVYDIPDQAEACRGLLDSLRRGDARGVVLMTAIQEIVFVLERQYKATRSMISTALQDIVEIPNLGVEHRTELVHSLIDYVERPGISFTDAFHCSMARLHHSGNVVSFDGKLSSVNGITRIEPGA